MMPDKLQEVLSSYLCIHNHFLVQRITIKNEKLLILYSLSDSDCLFDTFLCPTYLQCLLWSRQSFLFLKLEASFGMRSDGHPHPHTSGCGGRNNLTSLVLRLFTMHLLSFLSAFKIIHFFFYLSHQKKKNSLNDSKREEK